MATELGAIRVHGLKELTRAFDRMGDELRNELRDELIAVGEPVRLAAERLAVTEIRNVHSGDNWAQMRSGVTKSAIGYIVPNPRGVGRSKKRAGLKRPNFAVLLMDRAMEPALDQNQQLIVQRMEDMVDRLASGEGF